MQLVTATYPDNGNMKQEHTKNTNLKRKERPPNRSSL